MEWAIVGWNGQMREGVGSELCDGVYRFYPTVLFLRLVVLLRGRHQLLSM